MKNLTTGTNDTTKIAYPFTVVMETTDGGTKQTGFESQEDASDYAALLRDTRATCRKTGQPCTIGRIWIALSDDLQAELDAELAAVNAEAARQRADEGDRLIAAYCYGPCGARGPADTDLFTDPYELLFAEG